MNELKVLILDDESRITEKLKYHLEKRNFKVTTANTPKEGLDKLHEEKPGVLILDVMLPGMNGLDVTRTLRANPIASKANIPIIAMTATAMAGDKEKCIQAGMNDYITKPVETNFLHASVQKYVGLQTKP